MATFGLAHGAWHGGWCWGLLVDELVRRGHICVAPDLPYDDPSSTWDTVADVMTDALKGMDDPVLVGHSLGAMTIPLVALRRPVKLLVYLCSATPVATPVVGSPPSFQEGYRAYLSAVHVDELGRDSWKPEVAIRDMYRHLEPGLANWAAAQLRPDAEHGPYPLEGPPVSLRCTSTRPKMKSSRPSRADGPLGMSSVSSRSRSRVATSRCSRHRWLWPTYSKAASNRAAVTRS